MRIHMLENEQQDYLDIPDDISELDRDSTYRSSFVEKAVEFIKSRSQKFIDEFYTNGIVVYRGEDRLISDSIMTRKTREKRDKTFGTIASNDVFREQLNDYFEQQGISRRDQYVVFTTTQHPEDFKGVSVDEWFYFLPVGDYNYSYSKGSAGEGDINISADTMTKGLNDLNRFFRDINGLIKDRFLSNLRSMEKPIKDLNDQIVELNNEHNILDKSKLDDNMEKFNNNFDNIAENLDKLVKQSSDLEYLIDNGLGDIKKMAEIVINHNSICIDIYNTIKDELVNIDGVKEERETINKISSVLNELSSLEDELELSFIENDRISNVLEDFKENVENNFLTNTIDDGIEDNELWFNTKEYVLVPYNDIGHQIIEQLTI